jgi:hypothetical protein
MTRTLSHAAIAPAIIGLMLASTALAAPSDEDRLIELDRIAISHDLCGFALSDEQSEALEEETDKVVAALGYGEDDAQKLYDQINEEMQRQKPAGLCNPKGEWGQMYDKAVGDLAK